nr:orf immediately upstream of env - feline immunodeficiency virus [Feline immunodeficiency virus]
MLAVLQVCLLALAIYIIHKYCLEIFLLIFHLQI